MPTPSPAPPPPPAHGVPDHEILIVGAGFSGIGAGIRLRRAGMHDFLILEKAADLGGTWRDHDYPGVAVDVPAMTYSFPFAQNRAWQRLYATGAELRTYAQQCVQRFGLRPHMRFGCAVNRAEYDPARNLWRVHLENGTSLTGRYLVSATGFLSVPRLPEIPGIERFRGTRMHTARWDHSRDLRGARVAVIGTGASAIQVIPEIAPHLGQLYVFQRTPAWVLPKRDPKLGAGLRAAFWYVPGLHRLVRFAVFLGTDLVMTTSLMRYRWFAWVLRAMERRVVATIRRQVHDPAVQDQLIPRYSFGCKRPGFASNFYPVFNHPHVELVTERIASITEDGVVTADGRLHAVDTLVCATGFRVFERGTVPTFPVHGSGGQELGAFWDEQRYQAFMGATVPGFPNFFLILGPYSVCSASYFGMIDTQTRHLVRCLRAARKRGANYIEVRQESHDQDFRRMLARKPHTVFGAGNCAGSNSYYLDRHGDHPALRPTASVVAWLLSHVFRMKHYRFASHYTWLLLPLCT